MNSFRKKNINIKRLNFSTNHLAKDLHGKYFFVTYDLGAIVGNKLRVDLIRLKINEILQYKAIFIHKKWTFILHLLDKLYLKEAKFSLFSNQKGWKRIEEWWGNCEVICRSYFSTPHIKIITPLPPWWLIIWNYAVPYRNNFKSLAAPLVYALPLEKCVRSHTRKKVKK